VEALEDAWLQICLLGGFAVVAKGQPLPDELWRLRRAKTLVKLLALSPERRLHREQVVEVLWPDGDPAGNSLHQVLYTARRALGAVDGEPVRLALRDDVVTLTGDRVWVDVDEFEERAAAARRSPTVESYRAALDVYGGELLPEDRYEDWVAPRRESLRESHLGLLVELAELHAERQDVTAAVESLQRAIVENPLHEVAHRRLMLLFAEDGRRQQALAQYQQLRDALQRELAADPDPQTSALYREILAAQHEAEPEPEPEPLPGRGAQPGVLPRQLTSFVGRERELSELEAVLVGHSRLLTLTGPGGCGKTRLALELAARREGRFEQGARLVELAPVEDPALVVGATAAAIGAQMRAERDPVEMLAGQIGDARMLLVFDNCEHLIEACATLAAGLLRLCPNLSLLATSRERLRIQGEVAWRVPSLSLPSAGDGLQGADAERSEAVRLFCRRAADATGAFTLTDENVDAVAEICRRLDGMPLALELAAARTSVLSPEQIAERLGDALGLLRAGSRADLTRQQTLRATLEWSHDLLGEDEQVLYRRLGVFAGSFEVEAVEGICTGEDIGPDDALDLLARLADKSLVQVESGRDGNRYRLLETVRQHARQRLVDAGERDRVEAAHRAWYLALAEAHDRDADPTVPAIGAMQRLDAAHDDLRAALGSAIRHDPPAALRLANALWWFWLARGYFVEGVRWFEEVLAVAPGPSAERARALVADSGIRVRLYREEPHRIVALGTEALQMARRARDRHAEARGMERMGVIMLAGFDFDAAHGMYAEGLALAQEIGDEAVAVAIKQGQAVLAGCRGHNAEARGLLEECLVLLEDIPDERGPLFWATHISPAVLPAGPGGAPRMFFEDTWLLLRSVRSRAGSAYALLNIAEAWRSDGDYEGAREPLERAHAMFREIGDEQGTGVALNALGNLARSTRDFDTGRQRFAEALEIRRALADPREIATTLAGTGLLAMYAGDADAAPLLEQAMAIFERTDDGPGVELVPLNLGGYELDEGDPELACELLEKCNIVTGARGLVRNRGWATAELAEAAIELGDHARARRALDTALASFERLGEMRGTVYARGLENRLPQPAAR
jgi:predicted ATPase/DNA-binding SARP family transcriptional activator